MLGQGHGDLRDTADLVEREIEEQREAARGGRFERELAADVGAAAARASPVGLA